MGGSTDTEICVAIVGKVRTDLDVVVSEVV